MGVLTSSTRCTFGLLSYGEPILGVLTSLTQCILVTPLWSSHFGGPHLVHLVHVVLSVGAGPLGGERKGKGESRWSGAGGLGGADNSLRWPPGWPPRGQDGIQEAKLATRRPRWPPGWPPGAQDGYQKAKMATRMATRKPRWPPGAQDGHQNGHPTWIPQNSTWIPQKPNKEPQKPTWNPKTPRVPPKPSMDPQNPR